MRAYFLGNMYLSSIQQGIQAAHVTADMFIKYEFSDDADEHDSLHDETINMLYTWADEFKTMVLLNGGMSCDLRAIEALFDQIENPFPWTSFTEADEALDGAFTSIGIILPDYIYNGFASVRTNRVDSDVEAKIDAYEADTLLRLTSFERSLIEAMAFKSLAS